MGFVISCFIGVPVAASKGGGSGRGRGLSISMFIPTPIPLPFPMLMSMPMPMPPMVISHSGSVPGSTLMRTGDVSEIVDPEDDGDSAGPDVNGCNGGGYSCG